MSGIIGAPDSTAAQGAPGAKVPLCRLPSAPRHAVPLLIGLGLALFFIRLGHPMYTKGEPREGVTVIDVVSGRGFILAHRPLVEMPFKPPLMRWLAALAARPAGGVSELTMRLPSAVLAVLAMLLCYGYVSRLFGADCGLAAAVILGTNLQYLQAATGARVDMTLTFFLEAAFFQFLLLAEGLSRRWYLFYLALAGAVLSKGPLGLLLPAATVLVWSRLERRSIFCAPFHPLAGLAIVAVLGGSWYFAAVAVGGWAFVWRQLIGENVFAYFYNPRFSGGHAHSFLWLLGALGLGFFPWTAFLPAALWRLGRKPGPRAAYLAVWCAVALVFYGFAHQKRGVYLLAIYPALAALTGRFIVESANAAVGPARWLKFLPLLFGVLFLAIGVVGLTALFLAEHQPDRLAQLLVRVRIVVPGLATNLGALAGTHRFFSWLLPLLTLALAALLVGMRQSPRSLPVLVAALMVAVAATAELFFVPAIAETLTLKGFTRQVMRLADGAPIAYLGSVNYEIAFYGRRRIPILDAAAPPDPRFDYLIATRRLYDHRPAGALGGFRPALQSGPTELDGSGGLVLLEKTDAGRPRPAASRPAAVGRAAPPAGVR